MSFIDWVGTIGAIWLAVSILVAIFWGLVGRRVFGNRNRLDELGAARSRKGGA